MKFYRLKTREFYTQVHKINSYELLMNYRLSGSCYQNHDLILKRSLHFQSLSELSPLEMVKFYCTAGRGTEKFVKLEIVEKIGTENVIVTDGKIYFVAEISKHKEIVNLKSVERVFLCVVKSEWKTVAGSSHWHIKNAVTKRDLWENDEVRNAVGTIVKGLEPQPSAKVTPEDRCTSPVNKRSRLEENPTFRMVCRCTGRIGRKIDPMKLQRDLGSVMKKMFSWNVELRSPDIEISVHVSDDGLVVGVPLTRQPLSKRSYIQHFGLRSTIAYIMCYFLPLKAGDIVLDPMCGKATILVESAYNNKTVTYMGCDSDPSQLLSAVDNVKFANVSNIHLFQGNTKYLPLTDLTIDHVVCDAPFGNKHIINEDLELFYRVFLSEITRVLKSGGLIVLLTSQDIHQYLTRIFKKEGNSPTHSEAHQNCIIQKGNNLLDKRDNIGKGNNWDRDVKQDPKPAKECNTEVALNNHKPNLFTQNCELENDERSVGNYGQELFLTLLIFTESNYVKLGETHAYICVFKKIMNKIES